MAIHLSEAEAVRDIAGLLERVREGEEIVIQGADRPIAVIGPAPARPARLLPESVALAKQHEQ